MSKNKTPQELRAQAKPSVQPPQEKPKMETLKAEPADEVVKGTAGVNVTNESNVSEKPAVPLHHQEFTHLSQPVETSVEVAAVPQTKVLPDHDKVPRKMHKFL